MLQLDVTESIKKTDYYKKLIEWNDRLNVTTNDYIEVEIHNIDDMFIELYFDLQEDLDNTLNEVETFDKYNMFYIMSVINEYFYPDTDNPPFPFGVAVYLISVGHKDKFLKDIYYLALLYETPEVFNIFCARHFGRNKLISMKNDSLLVRDFTYDKYKIYPPRHTNEHKNANYDVKNIEPYQEIINNIKPYKQNKGFSLYNDELRFKVVMDYISKILKIKNVIIHGEFVNSLIHGRKEIPPRVGNSYHMDGYHVTISIYNENFIDTVEKIINIIHNDNLNVEVKQSEEDIYISFYTFDRMVGKRLFVENFKICKHVYTNINDVLESHDIDSQTCGMYELDNGDINIVYTTRYKFATENCLCVINPEHLVNEILENEQYNIYNRRLIENMMRDYNIFVPGAVHLIGNYILLVKGYPQYNTLKNLLYNVYDANINEGHMNEDEEIFEPIYVPPLRMIFRIKSNIPSHIPADISMSILAIENYMYSEVERLGINFDIEKLEENLDEDGENGMNGEGTVYSFRDTRFLKNILTKTLDGEYGVKYHNKISYSRSAVDYLSPN